MEKQEVLSAYGIEDGIISDRPYGTGHINDTFVIEYMHGEGSRKKILLQKMNHKVFKRPEAVMENIQNVTAYIREQAIKRGGDPRRETLNIILTENGKPYCRDLTGGYWRAYDFIEGATAYDRVEDPECFYQSAIVFGNFQRLLSEYPVENLNETIADFHNTAKRLEMLKKVVAEDPCGRASGVQEEIDFAIEREKEAHVLTEMAERGELPVRVTHNDTKLNNVMIDDTTGKGLCVVDLDTVMPGLSVYDFGDSIRFGASTAAEDEQDLSKVSCDMILFEIYTRGYLEGCAGKLTKKEIEMMPMGAKLMTFECGIRFLIDYLQGDVYFKIHRENHNLERCRTQFRLVADMENKWEIMNRIVKKYAK
ncbi:phosphotransferase enzyme family protein [Anaerobium acetethylicum]|uniref:Phosphotransferase enzyme family protein n=1 Tax=Anaerobium acetethylicum TaxID=1619234 RepID=A0A1D3TRJ3_9FIRM|nr:aminoglycoside phosphotransferase family protein [Anaerobium acetethylicum]SCP96324.1 Phosphotransferase enzyme family protein [Anaerobium acetethylicum]